MSGFIAISRDLWDSADFADGPMSQREAFIWMVAEAAWKPRAKRVGSTVVDLERGQLAHSVRFLASAWGWSKSSVARFLKALQKRDTIRYTSGTGATVITICNYDRFQPQSDGAGTAAGQQRDASGTNDNKGTNNSSSKTTSSPKSKRAERLPADWVPPEEFLEMAEAMGLTRQQAADQAERMRDWSQHAAKGAGMNWKARFRNWIKQAIDRGEFENGRSAHQETTNRRRSAFARVLRADERGAFGDEGQPRADSPSPRMRLVAAERDG